MFLVLHGQTEWNRDGKLQGHSDAPLTPEGERQARASGAIVKFHLKGAARIVASPLGRTQATARIVAESLGVSASAIETDARLAEIHMGVWQGLTRDQVAAGWPERMTGPARNAWHFRAPGGEDYGALAARLGAWLGEQDDHEMLIAVTHGVASRVLRGLYTQLAPDAVPDLEIARDAPFRLWNGHYEKLAHA